MTMTRTMRCKKPSAQENLSENTETIENPRAWLIRIARNVLLRRQERSRQEALLWQKKALNEEKSTNFTAGVLNGVLAESITEYIRQEFTPFMQEVFVLRHFHEMNLAEIAEVTELPLTSVHRLLTAITDRVQQRYESLAG